MQVTNIPVIRNKGDSESGSQNQEQLMGTFVFICTHTFTYSHVYILIHSFVQEPNLRHLRHVK